MKYLFDSLQSHESDHSHALCPVQSEQEKSFVGDQKLLQPVTNQDFQLFSKSLFDHINHLNLQAATPLAPGYHPAVTSITPTSSYGAQPHPPGVTAATQYSGALNPVQLPHASESTTTQANTISFNHGPSCISGAPVPPALTQPPPLPPPPPTSHGQKTSRGTKKRLAPIPGATIEAIPRGPDGWRVAVRQWDENLRDWDESMYKGDMRLVTAMNRKMRETIALEYDAYVGLLKDPPVVLILTWQLSP